MKDITRFINEELKPRLYGHIPEIFPELHFTKKGSKYVSNFHADGTEGTGYKEDRSVVTERQPTKVYDNTRQEAKDIITLFMENHHIGEVWEAVNRLCSIVGILPPESTPEGKERYRQQERRRTALEASAERQKAALFAPEGREVLDYLHYRGWTDNEIKEAELGYISTSEANTIQAQRGIGDFYTLSIPLRSGSVLYGFKFRTIRSDSQARDKYTYLFGTEKRNNLFNLTGIQQENGAMVVVEGELDALHAQVRGIKGIVATGGGKLTDELLETATGRGIKRITLLFDKDERGAKFVRESIDIAHKKGISILVATFPDGEKLSDGRIIHDVDEYLQLHTATDLQSLINNAVSGSIWLLEDIITTFGRNHGEVTQANEIDIRNRVISLANHTPNEVERELVLSYYANSFCIDGKQAFTAEAMQAVADRERATQNAIRRDEETQRGLREALALAEKGGTLAALQMAEETIAKAKKIGDRDKYGDLLKIPTREERIAKFREKPEGLTTSYEFTEGGEAALPFVIPSGALTIIAAPTSHGKSTFLRNLAIDVAKRYGDKSTLYFTFEESEEDVIAQFVNTYIGKKLHATSFKHPQLSTIINYYKTGKPNHIGGNNAEITVSEFERRERDFSSNFLDNGKIRIFYKDYDLETLIEALDFAVSNIPTRAIFIDYIQILRSTKFARQPRAEQLKEICISLKDFSVKYKIPVVLAAQLRREAKTPLRMDNTQMAESSDIEKAANTIICLWNSKFEIKLYGEKTPTKDEKDEIAELEKKGFEIGKDGKLFALVTKMRGSRGVGMYSIFDYKGYCGKVVENYDTEPQQQELPFKPEPENDDPF
jgi:KaiC/GvpD/RAD55 family RecA-like ATPase/5S rRNA maturation endonuclease (ribonuclease M5)